MNAIVVRRVAALLALALATACGSTVPVSQVAEQPGVAADGMPAPAAGMGPDATQPMDGLDAPMVAGGPGAPAAPAGSGPSTVTGGAPIAAPAGAQPAGTQDVTSAPAGRNAVAPALSGYPGITGKTVKIGIEIAGNASALRATFGIDDPTADPETAIRILFDHINANGGFGGLKGEYVLHEVDLASGDFETQAQAACSKFAEDEKVFAVISAIVRTRTIFECLAQRNTIAFAHYVGHAFPAQDWGRLANYLYAPDYVGVHRAGILVDAWVKQGLVDGDSKIGLISINDPGRQQFAAAIKQRLAHYGYKVDDEVVASSADDLSDLSGAGAEMSNAVLRFRSQDIDTVLFANTAGGGPFFFMPAAENQDYHPNYGISSYEFLRTLVGTAPPEALARSMGAGWSPAHDITEKQFLPPNRLRDRCYKILKDGGLQMPDNIETQVGTACEPFWLLRDTLARVTSGRAGSFREAFESLGRYASPATDPLYFAPGRPHDGISQYRHLKFNTECECFEYTAGPFPLE